MPVLGFLNIIFLILDISMTDRYSHLSVDHVTQRQEQISEHYLEGLSN
jgi:hypothetical protein